VRFGHSASQAGSRQSYSFEKGRGTGYELGGIGQETLLATLRQEKTCIYSSTREAVRH
jgi:hypothetical protein